MEEQIKENFLKAGKLSAEVLEFGKTLIKKGNSFKDTVDKIENKIEELGEKPAFPAQISCNEIAAHYCPDFDDESLFEDQLVSLDLGVHVDGAIGDNAYTVDLSGKYTELVKAAQKALAEAVKIIQVGVELGAIGKVIEDTIKSYGYNPVRNLSGHGLAPYVVHTKPTIPNFDNKDTNKIKEGMTFAVEPFATTGSGVVHEVGVPTVFMMKNKRPVRSPITRQVLGEIQTYQGVPFAKRWLMDKFGAKANLALRELKQFEMIHQYPPLVEVNKGAVAQAEHSILIDDDGKVHILTKN